PGCDGPTGRDYKELLEYYPESKVVLTVREPEGWIRSMRDTVWAIYFGDSVMHHVCKARAVLDPLWRRFMELMMTMTWGEDTLGPAQSTFDDQTFAASMDRWNERVKREVPADRLLVWEPRDGWEALCGFLGPAVPG